MNPMMRALTARLAKAIPGPMGMAAMSAGDFGKGEITKPDANGMLWGQYDPHNANGRVADAFNQVQGAQPSADTPMDRLKAAFDAVRGQSNPNFVPANSPGVFGPDAVMIGGPGRPDMTPQPPMNLAHYGVTNVPDRAPVMAQGGNDQQSPMSFFMRNAMMQQDPNGGGYLDPTQAAKAQASPFRGLFG